MTSKRAYVAGEALMDLIEFEGEVVAHVGGGPANTAKALARLGCDSFFVGGISTDEYGRLVQSDLNESGVNLSFVNKSNLPTALARAVIDENGTASYKFELEDTSSFAFSTSWLPTDFTDVIHVGSVATVLEPGASELYKWVSRSDAVVVFDPNVRPSIQSDKDSYRAAVEKWISLCDVVKLSEDDLSWLYSELEEEVIGEWLKSGVRLVVVTLGAAGLRAYFDGGVVTVAAAEISLVDTVGAGDTIGAILVEGVLNHGLSGLRDVKTLREVLNRAVKAAGITCSRAGANPPWRSEL